VLISNWLQRDPVLELFGTLDADGSAQSITDNEFVELILEPQLSSSVPGDVNALYEAARASMRYGYFFYPLYTLATQQLFRVAEAAVTHRCRDLKAPPGINGLGRGIDFLARQGVISDRDWHRWDAVRILRNRMTHSDWQEIIPPGMAIDSLRVVADLCSSLYPSS
jgi:hypothetical protein